MQLTQSVILAWVDHLFKTGLLPLSQLELATV